MENTIVVMPAYNVEKQIGGLLAQMEQYRNNIIIVDDGSTDFTFQIIIDAGFNVIRQEENKGISNAVKKGIDYALREKYEKVIFMDSDGQHSPEYIHQFAKLLEKYDFVTANRFYDNTTAPDVKICANLFVSMIVKKLTGYKCNDIACGFKAIRLSADLRSFLNSSSEYGLVYDLFFYALKRNYSIGRLNTEPIYEYSQLLLTRQIELISFIEAVQRHFSIDLLNKIQLLNLKSKVIGRTDFFYDIFDVRFYGFYIRKYDGYIIQANKEQLKLYMKENV